MIALPIESLTTENDMYMYSQSSSLRDLENWRSPTYQICSMYMYMYVYGMGWDGRGC